MTKKELFLKVVLLQKAIVEEDYEKAEKLRLEIKELDNEIRTN